MEYNDIDNIDIYDYNKKGSNIIINTNKGKKIKVFNSEKNEKLILQQMEKNFKKVIRDYDSLDNKIDKEFDNLTISTGITAILLSIYSINSLIKGNFETYPFINIGLVVDSTTFFFSSFCHYGFKGLKKDAEKYSIYFKNKNLLNNVIKQNPELLEKLKYKIQVQIMDNFNNKEIPPINAKIVDKMSLKELKMLLEMIKFYKINNFETVDEIIKKYNDISELTKKYDGLESIKKQKLTELVSILEYKKSKMN